MWVLAAETSTNLGSVCLRHTDGRIYSRESERQKSHSEFLHPAIEACLLEASIKIEEIHALAVGRGPGSFTGIRVAGNAMKALAWSLDKPLFAIDSLSILAAGQPPLEQKLYCMINAYRNMVYLASYRFDNEAQSWQMQTDPKAVGLNELDSEIKEEGIVIGDAYPVYRDFFSEHLKELLKERANLKNFPHACDLAKLALLHTSKPPFPHWDEFSPLYLRSTDSLFRKQRP